MISPIVESQYRDADPEAFSRLFGQPQRRSVRGRHHITRQNPAPVRGWDLVRELVGKSALTLILTATLTIPAFAAIVLSAPAKADPVDNYTAHYATSICTALDERPALTTITQLMDGIVADGFGEHSGRIMVDAVSGWCPTSYWLIEDYIAVYADPQHNTMVAAGRMGGQIA